VVEGASAALVLLVREETLDFCVSQSPSGRLDPGLQFKPLFRPPLVVVGRHGHPLRGARNLRDLAEASWLMFYPRGTGAMLETMFDAIGLPLPRSIVHCESYATALSLVSKTDVLALLSPQIVSDGWGQRLLQKIDIQETVPGPLLGLFSRAGTPLTPAAHAMAQALTATARRLARSV
jgi:DNA-binding transcriptional LysR family regulator